MWVVAIGAILLANLILYRQWRLHMDISEVSAKIDALKVSIDQLIALPTNPAPVDLQPLGDQIDAIKASVDAKLAG